MNKVLPFVLCLIPLSLFAAGVEPEHQVFLFGKPFSHAVLISGVWAIPLQDVARAAGMNMTLESAFQLQGNTLNAQMGWDVKSKKTVLFAPLIKVNKRGQITRNILRQNGQAFVPLTDFARAFGGVWKTEPAGNLAPGAVIQLNFPKDPNAILIGL
jgi:hypothetical protein